MTDVIKEIQNHIELQKRIPNLIGRVIKNLVVRNVEEYFEKLNNVDLDEELRMLNRNPRAQDAVNNDIYRKRVSRFKVINYAVKEQTGLELVDTFENPLKVALIDNALLQLFKVANELSLTIKNNKMDAGSLDALVEKAVHKAFQEKELPEVEDMFIQLITKVQNDVFDSFDRGLDSKIDKYLKTVVDRVI
jgi:hypothetical protein